MSDGYTSQRRGVNLIIKVQPCVTREGRSTPILAEVRKIYSVKSVARWKPDGGDKVQLAPATDVICDADLIFWNCIAKWPGSVHDAQILWESELFQQCEGNNKPLRGFILGDSAYMQRDWLVTPVANPVREEERDYNYHHSSACTTVERAIGILKRPWHCLRRLRLQPAKACRVFVVCALLHNKATMLNLYPPSD
ncbi:hypothetical protein BaRGS_00016605 [Batillaria attramentaria]|uniref:DDE Tnp4 domain-containing protein n=1 Tax=Batillaria attramentaria TaxID=370345 RepID=A0ABD0KXZ0_9CAEN